MVLRDSWTSHFEPLWFDLKSEDAAKVMKNRELEALEVFWKIVAASNRCQNVEEIRELIEDEGDYLEKDSGAFEVNFGVGHFRTTPLHEAVRLDNVLAGELS